MEEYEEGSFQTGKKKQTKDKTKPTWTGVSMLVILVNASYTGINRKENLYVLFMSKTFITN